jgi:hypothetical protein
LWKSNMKLVNSTTNKVEQISLCKSLKTCHNLQELLNHLRLAAPSEICYNTIWDLLYSTIGELPHHLRHATTPISNQELQRDNGIITINLHKTLFCVFIKFFKWMSEN